VAARIKDDHSLSELTEESERLSAQWEDLRRRGEEIGSAKRGAADSGEDKKKEAARLQTQLNLLREERDAAVEELAAQKTRWAQIRSSREAQTRQLERLEKEGDALRESIAKRKGDAQELVRRQEEYLAEEALAQDRLKAILAEIAGSEKKSEESERERMRLAEAYERAEQDDRVRRSGQRALYDERQQADNDLIRATGDLEHLQNRIWDLYEVTYAQALELRPADFTAAGAQGKADQLRRKMRTLGTVNLHAIEDYASANGQYRDDMAQKEDLIRSRDGLRRLADELAQTMREKFLSGFEALNANFARVFSDLFGGGRARLSLTDPSDPLSCGIEIEVEPPGKRLQRLSLLSGGEKAFTAIALLFAMLRLKPTPFCILDEIDAALDDANLVRYARYLRDVYARQTQFVVVTHRKPSMEICDRLYGVTMEERGVSKMISVELTEVELQEGA